MVPSSLHMSLVCIIWPPLQLSIHQSGNWAYLFSIPLDQD